MKKPNQITESHKYFSIYLDETTAEQVDAVRKNHPDYRYMSRNAFLQLMIVKGLDTLK